LVMLNKPDVEQTLRNYDVELLEEYPDSLLIRCPEAVQQALSDAGLEFEDLEQPDSWYDESRGALFNPDQIGYYVIQLIGPAKGIWLDTIRSQGGTILEGLPGYALIVTMLPDQAQLLAETESWVEKIGTYAPAYDAEAKIFPGLRSGSTAPTRQVEISFFRDTDATALVEEIRDAGGRVFSQTPQTVIAVVPVPLLDQLAHIADVQAILPHTFATPQNNRATEIMDIPHNRTFGSLVLDGNGQVVAAADTGLDTGNPDDIHPDFNGRIVGNKIKSWPVDLEILKDKEKYVEGDMIIDDGPGDPAGHGTHVAGTILGSGEAATGCDDDKPCGVAPQARLYFQAIGQIVPDWKKKGEIEDEPDYEPRTSRQVLWSIRDGDDLYQLFEDAYADEEAGGGGARIHTNSWSRGAPLGGYPELSRAVDRFMWTHRDMLILFAAGNNAIDEDGDGVINHGNIGPPGTAKNCLTVGSCENERPASDLLPTDFNTTWNALRSQHSGKIIYPSLKRTDHLSDSRNDMHPSSGRGSSVSRMVKPDVVAPGTHILSTRSRIFDPNVELGPGWGEFEDNKLYCWFGGTSMSTAFAAGAAALIRQYLVQERNHFEKNVKPSGALIKAFLINGAQEMTGELDDERPQRANHIYGFGRLNLAASLADGAFDNIHFVDDPNEAVGMRTSRIYEVQVADPEKALRVTLVWADRPNNILLKGKSGPNLQNKLLLHVLGPDGSSTSTDTPGNNVQRIVIEKPNGTYKIQIDCKVIIESSPTANCSDCQDFALVVSNVTHLEPVGDA
ncbi:MAG: S8 family serine peptidase, partial [Anaerolineae bacterium]|nr:S8 family serine peptidase [Anaerolineae bacterium]